MAITISNGFITKLQMASDGSFNILEDFNGTAGVITPSGSAGGSGGGGAGWYFYSDEGALDAPPPTANGNAIFLAGGFGGDETFNPNQSGDYNLLIFFNTINSAGTDFTLDFQAIIQTGGFVTITQGSNVAQYHNPNMNGMSVETSGPLAGVFTINTENCIQTQTAAAPFNANDVITLTFAT